jgi:hypothetical protein
MRTIPVLRSGHTCCIDGIEWGTMKEGVLMSLRARSVSLDILE